MEPPDHNSLIDDNNNDNFDCPPFRDDAADEKTSGK
jgi:hypothetical protein